MTRRWPSSRNGRASFTPISSRLFAQVTNPPIDPIREKLVMSVEVLAGAHRNWLEETPEHARLLRLQSPILTNPEMLQILAAEGRPLPLRAPSAAGSPSADGPDGLKKHLDRICAEAEKAVDERRIHSHPERLGRRRGARADSDAPRHRRRSIIIWSAPTSAPKRVSFARPPSAVTCIRLACLHRLRRLRHQSVRGVCDAQWLCFERGELKVGRQARRCPATASKNYRTALEKGLLENHVEDGHLDARQL